MSHAEVLRYAASGRRGDRRRHGFRERARLCRDPGGGAPLRPPASARHRRRDDRGRRRRSRDPRRGGARRRAAGRPRAGARPRAARRPARRSLPRRHCRPRHRARRRLHQRFGASRLHGGAGNTRHCACAQGKRTSADRSCRPPATNRDRDRPRRASRSCATAASIRLGRWRCSARRWRSGKLRGLTPQQLANALGIAASSSAGLFAFVNGGGDIKRLHAGHALAREGMQARWPSRVSTARPTSRRA